MKKGIITIVAIVLLATVLSGFSGQATAATPTVSPLAVTGVSWFSTNSTQQVVPGMNDVPLFVTFFNTVAESNLTVSLNLSAYAPGVFNYSYIVGPNKNINEQYYFPELPGQTTTTIEQTVNISGNAPNAIYLENLTFSIAGSSAVTYGNDSFNLPVAGTVSMVSPMSFFGTQSAPLIGTPGMSDVPLTVMVENTGNSAATNVSVSYTPSGSLTGATQHTVISVVPAYQSIPLTFLASVKDNASINQVYGQNLTVSYYGTAHMVPFSVPITGTSSISIVNYFTNPPVIFQDQKFISLTLVTENSGSSFAKNVSVSVSSPQFNVTSNPYNISYFPSGTLMNFTFLMNAKNYTGISHLSVTLGSEVRAITLNIHSHGSFSISSSIPALHTGASKQVISFNVTNTGGVTLYDFTMHLLSPSVISLHIPSSNPLAALTETNVTFAQITPGQTVTATFLVDTSSSATFTTYPAQLAISWALNTSTMPFYQTYNFNEKVTPTGVQSIQGMITFTPLNIAVLILIIVLIVSLVALAGRGRRLKKEAEAMKNRGNNEPFKQLPHKEYGGDDKGSQSSGDDRQGNR